jgi:hypothetical protein
VGLIHSDVVLTHKCLNGFQIMGWVITNSK